MQYKKVAMIISCLILCFLSSEQILAEDTSISFQDITLVEHVFTGNYPTSEEMLEIAKIQNDPSSFIVISLPHRFEDNSLSTSDTQLRGDIYCQPIQVIPVLAVDGRVDPRDALNCKHWPEVIQKGISSHKSFAKFAYYIAPNRQFVLKVMGIDQQLGSYDQVNLNVIFFQDWVPCQWKNGDKMVRNLARKLPLGPLGIQRNIPYQQYWEEKFDVIIPEETKQMYGAVAFLQDMRSLKILASGVIRFTSQTTPAYFSWKNWPKATYDIETNEFIEDHIQKTGLKEMTFQVKNAVDLRIIQIEMDYAPEESKYYDILGYELNPELQTITTSLFDLEQKKVNLYFQEPIHGDKEIFSWIVHWKKQNLDTSSSFKVKTFSAYNRRNEVIWFDIGDIRQYYPNMLLIQENPFDFSKDTWVNEDDMFLFIPYFGLQEGDKDYNERFDIVKKEEHSIDFEDFCALLSSIKEQYLIWKKLPTH